MLNTLSDLEGRRIRTVGRQDAQTLFITIMEDDRGPEEELIIMADGGIDISLKREREVRETRIETIYLA